MAIVKGNYMSYSGQTNHPKKDKLSDPQQPVAKEGSLLLPDLTSLTPFESWLLKIFPVHLLSAKHYIDLTLMSIAGAFWLSFVHILWWGVENAFIRIVFYATSLHLILLFNSIRIHFKEKEKLTLKDFLQIWAPSGACGIFFVVITLFGVGLEYRILADETNLLGSAMSLYIDQTYQNITEGTFYYDSFHITERVVDKRPPLFSYLITILHFLFGYHSYHGFVVNLVMAFVSGAIFFYIGRKYVDTIYGIMVVMCYASIPIVMIGMGSSGFEVMTAFFNTIAVWRTIEFLRNPTSFQLELVLLSLLAAAQGRYESIILTLPVGLAIISCLRRITWHPSALRLLIIPYLFVPLNWQKHITSSINGGDPEGTMTFSLTYFSKHLIKFFNFWFDWRRLEQPSNLPITLAAIMGFFLLTYGAIRSIKTKQSNRILNWTLFLSFVSMALIIGAQLCYYMGDVTEPAMQRFTIAYAPALAFASAYFFWRCYHGTKKSLFIPGILLVIFFLGMSIAGRNPLGKTLVLFREYKAMLHFVQKFPQAGTLILSGRPGMFTVHGYGAISHDTFKNRAKEWQNNMERKLFTNVIMEEFIYYDQQKNPREPLPPEFESETLYEYQNDAEYYIRFSRVHVKGQKRIQSQNTPSMDLNPDTTEYLKTRALLKTQLSPSILQQAE
jgi:4-amino-4-deoxy-L-arabinose transferase-like glycosyltransferase